MKNKIYEGLNEIKADERLKQNTYAFLQEKAYKKKKIAFKRFAVAFASVVVLFVAGLFSYNLYFTETAFIDIDVNPSIELTLNRFDRVIGTHAYNDDGKKVLDEINLQHKTYEDALKTLIDKMVEMGYIKDAGLFTATLQMKDGTKEKEQLDSIKAYIDSVLQSNGKTMEQDVFSVDNATKAHSHEQNLTPAKYLAILELQKVNSTATFNGCRDHSIGEIRQQIHDYMNGGEHDENNGGKNGHNNSSENDKNHGSSGSNHDTPDQTESHKDNATNSNTPKNENHRSNKNHGDGH